jgi:hydrogenase maturation protease
MKTEGVSENKPRLLLIGVGNQYRTDDAAGLMVVRSLKNQAPAFLEIIEESGEGASLMERWRGANGVIMVDAVSSGAPPGTIHRLDARRQAIPIDFFSYSTHAFSVAEAVEMARVLDQLPPKMIIYGIEGGSFEFGTSPSPALEAAVSQVIESILKDLEIMSKEAEPK